MKKKFCVYETINLINGKYYRGFCSNYKNIENNSYKGSGLLLHRAFSKYDYDSFISYVLKRFETRQEAFAYEKEVVIPHSDDPLSYNINKGGHGSWHASILAHTNARYIFNPETKEQTYAKDEKLEEYLNNGWKLGKLSTRNMTVINNGEISTRIHNTELDNYLNAGWIKGFVDKDVFKLDYIHHPITGDLMRVHYTKTQDYLDEGWIRGVNFEDYQYYYNPKTEETKRVFIYNKEEYIKAGFIPGSPYNTTKGYIVIHNKETSQQKQVKPELLEHYLDDCWEYGTLTEHPTKDTVILHNNETKEKIFIKPEEIVEYINAGYVLGRSKDEKSSYTGVHSGKIYITKNYENRRIEKDLLDDFLNAGWKRGMYKKKKHVKWVHHPETKAESLVQLSVLDSYLDLGYKLGRSSDTNFNKLWMYHKEHGRIKITISEKEKYIKLGYKNTMGETHRIQERKPNMKEKQWIHDPKTKRNYFANNNEIEHYLSLGFNFGIINAKQGKGNKGKIRIHKDEAETSIHPEELQKYLADG